MSVKFVLYGYACLLVTMASVLAHTASGQVKSIDEISFHLNSQSLRVKQVFELIEMKSDLRFFYYDKDVDLNQELTLSGKSKWVAEVLAEVSSKTDLKFKQINNTIAVNRRTVSSREPTFEIEFKTITGIVRDSDGEPLPGVTVFVEGASSGTVTDLDGRFSLETPDEGFLIFSFIGFRRERVNLATASSFDITLQPDNTTLQEVVVTGYGSQLKREVTGSISSVKGDDLARVQVPSFDAALQGRAAGVQVNQGSGVPGAPSRILIRGTSSISAGSEPLIVVDGFPLTQELTGQGGINSFMSINPADIEDIQILKDAAATAIYGSRGANGVILVTTKSGQDGKSSVNFNYSYGVQQPVNMVEMAGGSQWLRMVDQSFANDGFDRSWDPVVDGGLVSAFIDAPNQYLTRQMVEQVAASGRTDWLSPIWRQGSVEDVNISATRGNAWSSYFISLRYQDHKGLMNSQRLRTYGLRTNLDFSILDNLKTGIRSNFNYFENQQGQLGGSNEANPNGGRPDRGNRGGVPLVIGGGRTNKIAGQTNLFPKTPEQAEGGNQDAGQLKKYGFLEGGSGYAVGVGSSTGVLGHRRKFTANYDPASGATAVFLVEDRSENGQVWRLATPEFNEIQVHESGYTILAPTGYALHVFALDGAVVSPVSQELIPYGGSLSRVNPGIIWNNERYTHGKVIDFAMKQNLTVLLVLTGPNEPLPFIKHMPEKNRIKVGGLELKKEEQIQLIALEEGIIPWWYGEGGWEPISRELLQKP